MNNGTQLEIFERPRRLPPEARRAAAFARRIVLPRVQLTAAASAPAAPPPDDEPPLERLVRRGPRSLSDAEVVALLVCKDDFGQFELEAVRDLLREIGGLEGVAKLDESFFYRSGWGEGPSGSLLAAVELARRLARLQLPKRLWLEENGAAATYLSLRYQGDQEVLGALYLDVRGRLIAEREIFRGTLHTVKVEPRDILKQALLMSAASFYVFHAHPSGDPAPSTDDLHFTRHLVKAAQIVGVPLQDHLILGTGGRWVSLKARGRLNDS